MRSRSAGFLGAVVGLFLGVCAAFSAEEKRGAAEWQGLAEKGDAEGQFQYAELLGKGQGVPRDEFEAVRFLRKSAEQGFAKAQAALGSRLKSGNGVEQDVVEALGWLEKAAEQGELAAQTTVALCYVSGDGTPRNEVAGARWLQRASKGGSRFADSTLNSLQLRGAPATDEAAAVAYRALASKGDVAGMVAYGACLEEGRGVAKNAAEAVKWFLFAAKKGDVLAKYRAGLLQQAAAGTQTEAYEWLSIAGIEGIGAARVAAAALEKKLAPEVLATAKAHVKERAKPPVVAEAEPNDAEAGAVLGVAMKRILQRTARGSGTGFFISEDGFLVTNHHVVEGGKRFELQRGDVKLPAKVIRTNAKTDLAVLKAEGEFPVLEILSSDAVSLGDAVHTVGFPRPNLLGVSPKYSDGVVGSLRGLGDESTQFQVSLPLQPGNSGGALVNKEGKVIGVVVSVMRGLQAVNYAVKSKHLLELLSDIPDWQKRPPKAANRETIKQTEAAAVLIWVYEE